MTRPARSAATFELDQRVELLSALLLLARPERRAASRQADSYADAVRARFAPFAAHPAVAALRELLGGGKPEPLLTEVALLLPDAGGLVDAETSAFFALAADFGRASGAGKFFASMKRERAGFIRLAETEAKRGQKPAEVEAYLRTPFPGRCRMILAPLLPREFAVNVSHRGVETRVRCGSSGHGGKLTFELDAFYACVAHERVHTVVVPLITAERPRFEALPGLPPKACRDRSSWEGCYEEHLVRAITLRARGRAGGEEESSATLRAWSRDGYPYLPRLCSELRGFEKGRGSFAEFHPRLLAAFLLESQA